MLDVSAETHRRWRMADTMRWRDGIIMATPDQPPIFATYDGKWIVLTMPGVDAAEPDPEWVKVVQHEAVGMLAPIRRDGMQSIESRD